MDINVSGFVTMWELGAKSVLHRFQGRNDHSDNVRQLWACFTYSCLVFSSITTKPIVSLCAASIFVWLAFSGVLISPVPTVVRKSKTQCLLLFPRCILLLVLFVFGSVCNVWLCPSFQPVLLCCLQLCTVGRDWICAVLYFVLLLWLFYVVLFLFTF